ncbi:MAG: AAA family ATPase, partial [Pseudoflavonifractor sp.]
MGMLSSSGKKLDENCDGLLTSYISANSTKKGFGNARGIRNLRDRLIETQSLRLSQQMSTGVQLTRADFQMISQEDLCSLTGDVKEEKNLDYWLEQLRGLTGLEAVKQQVESKVYTMLARQSMAQQKIGKQADFGTLHMVFKGNAGTGKTTVARILAGIYNALGLLPLADVFVECGRSDLVGQYQGHTAQKVKDVVNRALGGVLFVDEAYSLCRDANDSFGREAIDALVADMENHRKELMVIFAGYSDDMDHFFQQNQGLASRVPTTLLFEDYTLDELCQIFKGIMQGKGFQLTQGGVQAAREALARASIQPDFGNARGVRNLADRVTERHTARLGARLSQGSTPSHEEYLTITEQEFSDASREGEDAI